MVERFLTYSLQNGKKIAVVLMEDGVLRRVNLRVVSVDAGRGVFTALLSGKRRAREIALSDALTADYARGDHGDLEE